MLATGLSGLYSLLPTSLDLIEDDWVSPLTHLQDTVPELKSFMQALSYCNSVLQVSTCTLLGNYTGILRNNEGHFPYPIVYALKGNFSRFEGVLSPSYHKLVCTYKKTCT